MDIKLNIQEDEQKPQKKSTSVKGVSLSTLNEFEISKVIANLGKQNRPLIVPIGFPGAGKSLLLSSLFWYGQLGSDDNLFSVEQRGDIKGYKEGDEYFVNGKVVSDEMVRYFTKGNLYARNNVGSLDLIGVDIIPAKHEKNPSKFPRLPLSFLDLSGEDVKKIKTSEGGEFNSKIDAIFKGIQAEKSPLIFFLVTSFEPFRADGESLSDAHSNEDFLHYNFLNYISTNQPNLLSNSLFVIIVSKWDKNRQYRDAEEFIRDKRKSIYNFVKNSTVVWGEYSVGTILENTVDGVVMQEVISRNEEYPSRLWKMLYKICTKKDLDPKTFWQKLLS